MSIVRVIDLGPDDYSDEVSLQVMRCSACNAGVIAVYEESRRGSDARWHHDGWPATDDMIAELDAGIAACPTPRKYRCSCATHRGLAGTAYRRYLTGTSFKVSDRL